MKSMNLFNHNGESSKTLFGAREILPPTSIQDDDGNLTFSLAGKIYSLNVNSKEERERVKEEVNVNALAKYDWFMESTGLHHWVLYNTEMYELESTVGQWKFYLQYKEDSNLVPVIPINATSCRCMFYNCENLTSLDLSRLDTSGVTDMRCMFRDCKNLTAIDLCNFDTSNVTNMSEMFYGCRKLITLDLSSFDTSKVTAMYGMFSRCYNLKHLDISNFNTFKVTAMGTMFNYCLSLKTLNLTSFDTRNVTDMHYMFEYCDSITSIYISDKWKTNRVTYSYKMFEDCHFLLNFNEEKINVEMAKPVEEGGYLTLKR